MEPFKSNTSGTRNEYLINSIQLDWRTDGKEIIGLFSSSNVLAGVMHSTLWSFDFIHCVDLQKSNLENFWILTFLDFVRNVAWDVSSGEFYKKLDDQVREKDLGCRSWILSILWVKISWLTKFWLLFLFSWPHEAFIIQKSQLLKSF